jgi:putative membrane protein
MLTTSVLTALVAHPGWGMGPGGGFGWWILLIPLFWIIVVVALFAIFGRRWRRGWNGQGPYPYGHGPYGQAQTDAGSAEKTLAERFAQGDIDEVEYRARLEVLRANRPGPPAT